MQNNFNVNDLTNKLQQLQNQVAQFNQIQAQPNAPAATSYPKVLRSDTVEDILSNPQWKQELEAEFDASDAGAQAKNQTNVMFMQFCEGQTGKPSTMLDGLRREAKAKEKPTAAKPTKKNDELPGKEKQNDA